MKKTLILSATLVLAATGCRLMDLRPDPTGDQCSAQGGTAPDLPPIQYIPSTAPPPSLPSAQFIVVGTCEPTGTYVAAGVDTQARRFTFLIKGTAATRSAAFAQFYAAGVPVSVYTAPVRLRASTGTPAPSEPPPPGPAPTPTPSGDSGTGDDPVFRPCDNIGDDPEDPKIPTGYPPPDDPIWVFQKLSWYTANALDAVTDPTLATRIPSPRR